MLFAVDQKQTPDLLAEWLTLSISPFRQKFTRTSLITGKWVYTNTRSIKTITEYHKKHYPDEDQKVWVKPQKGKLSFTRPHAGCAQTGSVSRHDVRVSVASGIGA